MGLSNVYNNLPSANVPPPQPQAASVPAPTPPQSNPNPIDPSSPQVTPLHGLVATALSKGGTPDQVHQALTDKGVHPAVAAKVIGDVVGAAVGAKVGKGLATPNVQSTVPSNGSQVPVGGLNVPPRPLPPGKEYVSQPPPGLGFASPQAAMQAHQAAVLAQADYPTPTAPTAPPNVPAQANVTPGPVQSPLTTPQPGSMLQMGVRQTTPPQPSMIDTGVRYAQSQATPNNLLRTGVAYTGQYPKGSDFAPGVKPPVTSVPNVPPKSSHRGWLDTAGRLLGATAPALAALAIGRSNPRAGAALLGVYNQGKAQLTAEQARQAQVKQAEATKQAELTETTRKNKADEEDNRLRTQAMKDDTDARIKALDPQRTEKVREEELKELQGAPNSQVAYETLARQHPELIQADPNRIKMFQNPDGTWLDHNPYVVPMTAAQKGNLDAKVKSEGDTHADRQAALVARVTQFKALDADTAKKIGIDGTRADEQARHNHAMEIIGNKNATAHWISSNASQHNADNNALYKTWQMNGGKVADPASKSVYGSVWGTVYDKTVNARDAATDALKESSQQLADFRKANADSGIPDAPTLVANVRASQDKVTRLDAQIEHMNNVAPVRSQHNPNPNPKNKTGAQVNPSAKAALRAALGM